MNAITSIAKRSGTISRKSGSSSGSNTGGTSSSGSLSAHADGIVFVRVRAQDVREELAQIDKKYGEVSASGKSGTQGNTKRRLVMKKVVANITMGNHEMILLFPEIHRLIRANTAPTADLGLKKLCFHFLSVYATAKPDLAIKLLPVMFDDFKDSSPVVRALVLRTLSSVSVKQYITALVPYVADTLADKEPLVRKCAAYAVAKIWQHEPRMCQDQGLIESLNDLLKDHNATVVASALCALNDITEHTPGLKLAIDAKHARSLLTLAGKTSEWYTAYIFTALMNYVPEDSQTAVSFLDKAVPMLQHENTAVVMSTVRFIVYLSNYVEDPVTEIPVLPKRLGTSLMALLAKSYEIQYLVLRNVVLLLLSKPQLLQLDVRMFFVKYNDPSYIKDNKLDVMYLLATEENIDLVVTEMEEYASEIDVLMARKATRAIGKLAIKIEDAAHDCIAVLTEMLETRVSYVVLEIIVALRDVFRRYPDQYLHLLPKICEPSVLSAIDEPEAKEAMIWIVGNYSDRLPDAGEILEQFFESISDDPLSVKLTMLTAAVKYFILKPKQAEKLLIRVLKFSAEESDNPDLRDRGYFYWRLLSEQGKKPEYRSLARKVVFGEPGNQMPLLEADTDKLEPLLLEELEMNIGMLVSVYLKPTSQVFRSAKSKFLPDSPALAWRKKERKSSFHQANTGTTTEKSAGNVNLGPDADNDRLHSPTFARNLMEHKKTQVSSPNYAQYRSNGGAHDDGDKDSFDSPGVSTDGEDDDRIRALGKDLQYMTTGSSK